MTLREEIDKLASALAARASAHNAPLAEATNALKAVTEYYAVLLKNHKHGEKVDDEPDFADFAAAVTGDGKTGAATGGSNGHKSRIHGRGDGPTGPQREPQ